MEREMTHHGVDGGSFVTEVTCGIKFDGSKMRWMRVWDSPSYPITCPDCLKLKPTQHDPDDPAQRCCWHEWCEQPRSGGNSMCENHHVEYLKPKTSWECLQFGVVDRVAHSKSVKPTLQPSTTTRGFTFPIELVQILPATVAWYIQTTTKAGKK